MTIISGVNSRPKNVGQKSNKKAVSQKLEHFYTGSRKKSISYVIVVVEKKCYMFWNLDMMRSNEKKNHQNPSTNKKSDPGKPPNLKDVNIPRVNFCDL